MSGLGACAAGPDWIHFARSGVRVQLADVLTYMPYEQLATAPATAVRTLLFLRVAPSVPLHLREADHEVDQYMQAAYERALLPLPRPAIHNAHNARANASRDVDGSGVGAAGSLAETEARTATSTESRVIDAKPVAEAFRGVAPRRAVARSRGGSE